MLLHSVLLSGVLLNVAATRPAGDDDLLERALRAHELTMRAVETGEGQLILEFHTEMKGKESFAAQFGADAAAQLRQRGGIDYDNGSVRARGHWWFSGKKTRLDRTPLPLKKGEMILNPFESEMRSACDGRSNIMAKAAGDLISKGRPDWTVTISKARDGPTQTLPDQLRSGQPVDLRWFLEPEGQPLRAYLARQEQKGYKRQVEERDGKVNIVLTHSDGHRRGGITLDPAAGYMIAEGHIEMDGETGMKLSNTYQQIDGKWFAQELSGLKRSRDPQGTRDTTSTYRLTIENVKLGKPIEHSVFTLEGLDLPPGSRINDFSRPSTVVGPQTAPSPR